MDRLMAYGETFLAAALLVFVTAATYVVDHINTVLLLIIIVGILALLYEYRRMRSPLQGEDKEMASKRRLAQLKVRWADKIHDFLFEEFVEERISRKEYKEAIRVFGHGLDLPDLKTKSWKKNSIRSRVLYATTSMKNAMANVKAGSIPGPKPGEGVPTVIVEPQPEFGSKLLSRHAKAA